MDNWLKFLGLKKEGNEGFSNQDLVKKKIHMIQVQGQNKTKYS